jgi:hypothetical protein
MIVMLLTDAIAFEFSEKSFQLSSILRSIYSRDQLKIY